MINFAKIITEAEYFEDPCPHWIVNNFFSKKELERIDNNYPDSLKIFNYLKLANKTYQQNTAYQIEYRKLKGIINESNLIMNTLYDWNNQREEILNYIKKLPFARNYPEEFFDYSNSYSNAFLRASSPVELKNTSQLGPHFDNPRKLMSGMIYLRDENDNSVGGNFTFYKVKKDVGKKICSSKRRIELKNLTSFKTIPYKRNTALFFIPDQFSIHGVTKRGLTKYERKLLNLSISFIPESNWSLFDINDLISSKMKLSFSERILRKFNLRKGIKDKYGIYDWIEFDKL